MRNFLTSLFTPELRTAKIDSDPPGSADITLGTSINANGKTLYGFPNPLNPDWVANKAYVDSLFGPRVLASVRVTTPFAAITLSGLQTIDGVALNANDRVLVRGQGNGFDNGVWLAQTGAWTRPADGNAAAHYPRGTIVPTGPEGTAFRNLNYTQISPSPVIWGTDVINFRVVTVVDVGGSLQGPVANGVGHVWWDTNNKCLLGWDGAGWYKLGPPRVCTSSTRPGFTSDETVIYETDTQMTYIYQGGSWRPLASMAVQDKGVTVETGVSQVNFVGAGVSISDGPSAGQVIANIPGTAGGLLQTVVLTAASSTFVKTNYPGATGFLVQCIGGGGGGGGAAAVVGTGGAGGGGGGYAEKFYTYANMPASVAVTVGAFGAGGGGANPGANGADTTFDVMIAGGGAGGTIISAVDGGNIGGMGGVGSGGDLNLGGEAGWGVFNADAITAGGQGGAAARGGGGGRGVYSAASTHPGGVGQSYGGGGGGARTTTGANNVGGNGAPGVVIVYVYGNPAGLALSNNPVIRAVCTIASQAYGAGVTGFDRHTGGITAATVAGASTTGDITVVSDGVTINVPGLYLVNLQLNYTQGTTNTGHRRIASIGNATNQFFSSGHFTTGFASQSGITVSGVIWMDVGAKVCAWRYSDLGGGFAATGGSMTVVRLSD